MVSDRTSLENDIEMLRLVLEPRIDLNELVQEAELRIDEYPTNPQVSIGLEVSSETSTRFDTEIMERFKVKGWIINKVVRIENIRCLIFNRKRLQ